MLQIISNSEQETIEFAYKIAKQLNRNTIIVLTGDLGSGKTKFTEGILKYYGLENEISSPTFTLVNEYNTEEFNIYHFDVYRLSDEDEFYAIGGEEYFEKGACIIEWGEMIENLLPKNYIKLSFSKDETNENRRIINIECFGNSKLEI
ncbi:MAG: tRNA (adenosine(37)-N6)-threonylcarbamoyltransferase complex ATPase subunit type 1 TsaE [Clostridia bacterium]|nr:tRNA (adenosine(37)-N6)-threonylcarbamoyltransferase complex ATPase subunit type 1 TsaE [Clostridia bacterium]